MQGPFPVLGGGGTVFNVDISAYSSLIYIFWNFRLKVEFSCCLALAVQICQKTRLLRPHCGRAALDLSWRTPQKDLEAVLFLLRLHPCGLTHSSYFPGLSLALVLLVTSDSVQSFKINSGCSIQGPKDMVEWKGAKDLESLGLYSKLHFSTSFHYIVLKCFSFCEAHILHQFSCFGLWVLNTQLKVFGIIEVCFSHISRNPEAAKDMFGYCIASSFVIILAFPSCL